MSMVKFGIELNENGKSIVRNRAAGYSDIDIEIDRSKKDKGVMNISGAS